MMTNPQTTKITIEQFVERMRPVVYEHSPTDGDVARATRVQMGVIFELGIKQAEISERLATAMETMANEQQKQSTLLAILVNLMVQKPGASHLIKVGNDDVGTRDAVNKLLIDSLSEQLRQQ